MLFKASVDFKAKSCASLADMPGPRHPTAERGQPLELLLLLSATSPPNRCRRQTRLKKVERSIALPVEQAALHCRSKASPEKPAYRSAVRKRKKFPAVLPPIEHMELLLHISKL